MYYRNFANSLFEGGDPFLVGVFNPASVSAYMKSKLSRTKTDRQDSLYIARYTLDLWRDGAFRPWEPEKKEFGHLRQLVIRRDQLVSARTMELNRLHALRQDSETLPFLLSSVEEDIARLEERILEVESRISDHIDRHSSLREDKDLLESIPGIGETTASALLAHLGDIRRFGTSSQIVAHAGLAPRERQSGTSVRGKARICRTGKSEIRRALYMPIISASTRYNPVLRAYYERLVQLGKPKKVALVACMNKLLRIIWSMIKNKTMFDPNFVPLRC